MLVHFMVAQGSLRLSPFVSFFIFFLGFPGGSAAKESACNAGDPSSISGAGRSAGKGIGYPIWYSLASLVTQLVKNPPAMWETWVRSLGWEDPLEKGLATHSRILAWRIPWTERGQRSLVGYSPWGHRVRHDLVTFTFSYHTQRQAQELARSYSV